MNKMKRLFVGLLALVLIVVMMPAQTMMTVQAATPTIDTSQKGSLTIHKYEYVGDASQNATGTSADKNNVPTEATPLAGVTFKVTKVFDLDDYYGVDGEVPTLRAAEEVAAKSAATASDNFDTIGNWMEKTTQLNEDNDAIVKFEDLPLGIYYVEEVNAPSQITTPMSPFLVSIPMTSATGDDWIYHVDVYPKNASTYGTVYLKKYGKVGDGTQEALDGAKFILELGEDTDSDGTYDKWTQVTTDDQGNSIGDDGTITTGTIADSSGQSLNGMLKVENLAPGRYRFVEQAVPDNSGYILDKKTVYEFEIKADGLVYSVDNGTVSSTASGTLTNPIEVVNYKPDIDKDVKNVDGVWGTDADYSAEDIIPYRIVIDVPSNVADLQTFTVTDEMTNLTYEDGFTITGYGDEYVEDTKTGEISSEITGRELYVIDGSSNTAGITYTPNDAGWTVIFDPTSVIKDYKKIVITYNAKLSDEPTIAGTGNPNDVTLTYSNIITTDGTGDSTTDVKDRAVVYSFKMELTKQFIGVTDASETNSYIAKFQLYRATKSDEIKSTTIKYKGDSNTSEEIDVVEVGTPVELKVTSGNANTYTFTGLENGDYYLVETDTADGYNLLKEPVKVTINIDYETVISLENGKLTTTTTYYETNEDGTQGDAIAEDDVAIKTTTTTTIVNNKGFTLPVTGGMGMFSFIIVGVSMMIAAVVLLITSKKKEATNK